MSNTTDSVIQDPGAGADDDDNNNGGGGDSADAGPLGSHADVRSYLGRLYQTALHEIEDDSALSEIDPETYRNVSEFVGNLRRQRYSGIEEAVKERAIATATEAVSLLLVTRLAKASALRKGIIISGRGGNNNSKTKPGESAAHSLQRLLDEEKFVLDMEEERDERRDVVLSATTSGRSKLLETISENHKTGRVVVRFVQDAEPIVGVDMEMYGPFRAEDIATIPHENVQALVADGIAVRVRWEDYGARF